MPKLLSCNLTDEGMDKLEFEAKKYAKTKTEMTQKIFDFYFTREQRQQNMDTVMGRLDRMETELITLRAFLQRYVDSVSSEEKVNGLRTLAKQDAAAYLEQLRGNGQ